MTRFKARLAAASLTLSAVLATSMAAHGAELRMLSSWDDTYLVVPKMAGAYIEMVEQASGGEITIGFNGPEVVPPFEQLQPVAAGVYDLLFTHGAYHSNDTGAAMALDAIDPDPEALRQSGVWDAVDEEYRARGLKLLATPALPDAYNLFLKEPIGESCNLEGRQIRATPSYIELLRQFGASSVVLPPAEIYSALERGVVDGAGWPVIGALDFRWYEVADYFLRPSFGTAVYPILMNLDRFEALSEDQQALLLDQGRRLETDVIEIIVDAAQEEEVALREAGMRETLLCEEAIDTLAQSWADGTWSVIANREPELAERLRTMSVEAGISR